MALYHCVDAVKWYSLSLALVVLLKVDQLVYCCCCVTSCPSRSVVQHQGKGLMKPCVWVEQCKHTRWNTQDVAKPGLNTQFYFFFKFCSFWLVRSRLTLNNSHSLRRCLLKCWNANRPWKSMNLTDFITEWRRWRWVLSCSWCWNQSEVYHWSLSFQTAEDCLVQCLNQRLCPARTVYLSSS